MASDFPFASQSEQSTAANSTSADVSNSKTAFPDEAVLPNGVPSSLPANTERAADATAEASSAAADDAAQSSDGMVAVTSATPPENVSTPPGAPSGGVSGADSTSGKGTTSTTIPSARDLLSHPPATDTTPGGVSKDDTASGDQKEHGPNASAARPETSETLLTNGLKLVICEDHSFPVVSCLTWYKVGSKNETVGSTGISHLLEHLLFGNVGPFRKGEIAASIARLGGQFNGYTSDDFTAFFETLPAARLETALRIESQRMRGAAFTDADVQQEVANIQNEFEAEGKDPLASATREVRAALYQQHPYHNPTMGWRSDVENLTAVQVKAYYDRFFWPDNCTLVVSGDVSAKTVIAAVQRYFGGITKSPVPIQTLRITEPPQRGERRIVVRHPGKQEILQVAYHAPSVADADAAAMVVLEKLMNAPLAGRLKMKLIDPKICASASATFESKKDPGFFTINCVAIPGTPNAQQKLNDAVDGLVSQLKTQAVSETELRRARNLAEFAFFSETESPYRAGFHLGYFDSLSRWQDAFAWPEHLRSVSANDILRVAKRYLNNDARVVAWLPGAAAPKPAQAKPSGDSPSSPPGKTPPSRQFEHTRLTGYKDDDFALAPGKRFSAQLCQRFGNAGDQLLADLAVERDMVYPDGLDANALRKNTGAAVANSVKNSDSSSSSKSTTPVIDDRTNISSASPTGEHGSNSLNSTNSASSEAVKTKWPKSAVSAQPSKVEQAITNIPAALPAAVKDLPAAIGGAPGAIKEIPAAVQAVPAVIRGLPNAVESLPGAIKQLPGAVGSIPSAIKGIPGAIGGLPGAAMSAVKQLPGAIGGLPGAAASAIGGIPGAAASTLKGLPGAIGGMPGAAATAVKGMPGAIGSMAVEIGGLPSTLGKQLAPAHSVEANSRVAKRILKNGMTLIVYETHLSPVIQIEGGVRAGQAYEPAGKPGLAALTAAILNQGSARRGKIQVQTQQEDLGLLPPSMLKFDDQPELIQFKTRCLSRDLQSQLDLIAESLSNPATADADVEKAKNEVVWDLKQNEDGPDSRVNRALLRSLLAGNSAYLPQEPAEIAHTLPSLTAGDAKKFLSTNVIPSATTLVLVGDIDADRATRLVEHSFEYWNIKGTHQRLHAHPNAKHISRTTIPTHDKGKATVCFGQLVPVAKNSAEYGSLLIADAVFSGHPLISRLNRKLSNEPAFAQALDEDVIETDIRPLSNALAWSFTVSVEPNAIPSTIQNFQMELKQLARAGVTSGEFAEVKRFLLGSIPVRHLSGFGPIAHTLLDASVHTEGGDNLLAVVGSLRTASVESVNRVIRGALRPDQTTLVVMASPQSIRSVRSVAQNVERSTTDTTSNGSAAGTELRSRSNSDRNRLDVPEMQPQNGTTTDN